MESMELEKTLPAFSLRCRTAATPLAPAKPITDHRAEYMPKIALPYVQTARTHPSDAKTEGTELDKPVHHPPALYAQV